MTDSNSYPHGSSTTTKTTTTQPVPVASIATPSGPPKTAPGYPKKNRLPPILDNRWFVLGAIFGAMMFLGLPLLWRCPAFSWIEKLVWTIMTLAYSYAIIWAFLWVMRWSWSQIQDSL